MMQRHSLPSDVRDTLTRLAQTGDREAPTVFAGRQDEFALLDKVVQGVRRGGVGRTIVIQGVPGAGKTALSNEYAIRLLDGDIDAKQLVVPVLLDPSVLDSPPAAIIEEIDLALREFTSPDNLARRMRHVTGGALLTVNALFALFTKKDFNSFRSSARAPDSLPIALDNYASFRLGEREKTIVLLVDEAQNLADTPRVRNHLGVLNREIKGRTKVLLACFGLNNTVDRLRDLGLSRLANGHVREIGVLSDDEARQSVTGTIESVFARFTFDDDQRSRWINEAAKVILAQSANFPHHMANGCRALAEIVLDEGIGAEPPTEKLREQCLRHKREYYDVRLRAWDDHTIALAHAFNNDGDGWTPAEDVKKVLMASDNHGDAVSAKVASKILRGLCAHGFVENQAGAYRPVLPSLLTHFEEFRQTHSPSTVVVKAVLAAVNDCKRDKNRTHLD